MRGQLLERWRKRFERGTWAQETNCQKVRTALFDLFDKAESAVNGKTAEIYFALPKNNDPDWMGSYWRDLSDSTEHLVVVNDTLSREWKWKILQHEAAHHAGFSHSGSFNAYSAEGCATLPDDDDDGGGGGPEDDPDDDETCITETVWEERWVSCPDSATCNPSCLLEACIQLVYVPVEVTVCY